MAALAGLRIAYHLLVQCLAAVRAGTIGSSVHQARVHVMSEESSESKDNRGHSPADKARRWSHVLYRWD